MIAHREIGPADRSLEQHVANQRQVRRRMVEDDMAGRVAGAMDHIQHQIADCHLFAVLQTAIGLERLTCDAITCPLVPTPYNPDPIPLLRSLNPTPTETRQ